MLSTLRIWGRLLCISCSLLCAELGSNLGSRRHFSSLLLRVFFLAVQKKGTKKKKKKQKKRKRKGGKRKEKKLCNLVVLIKSRFRDESDRRNPETVSTILRHSSF